MDTTLPEPTLYDLASKDVGEIRVFLTNVSDSLHDVDMVKDCLREHLLEIAKHDPNCFAPLKPLFDSGAFDQVKGLVDTIRTAVVECDEYVLKSLRRKNPKDQQPAQKLIKAKQSNAASSSRRLHFLNEQPSRT
jgi:hypothetical protein